MPKLRYQALLPLPAATLFAVVNDVAAYPEYLPGCREVEIHRHEPGEMQVSVAVRIGDADGLNWESRITTCNRYLKNRLIEMRLEAGGLRALSGRWDFHALAERACRLELALDLDFAVAALNVAAQPVLERGAERVIRAVRQRAQEIDGGR